MPFQSRFQGLIVFLFDVALMTPITVIGALYGLFLIFLDGIDHSILQICHIVLFILSKVFFKYSVSSNVSKTIPRYF